MGSHTGKIKALCEGVRGEQVEWGCENQMERRPSMLDGFRPGMRLT